MIYIYTIYILYAYMYIYIYSMAVTHTGDFLDALSIPQTYMVYIYSIERALFLFFFFLFFSIVTL